MVSLAVAIMSITYSTIAFGASVGHGQVPDVPYNLDGFTLANGLFGVWNALGTVAFAYGGHNVVLEIQVGNNLDRMQNAQLPCCAAVCVVPLHPLTSVGSPSCSQRPGRLPAASTAEYAVEEVGVACVICCHGAGNPPQATQDATPHDEL